MTISVYNNRDIFSEPALSPSPPSFLTHVHRCIGFPNVIQTNTIVIGYPNVIHTNTTVIRLASLWINFVILVGCIPFTNPYDNLPAHIRSYSPSRTAQRVSRPPVTTCHHTRNWSCSSLSDCTSCFASSLLFLARSASFRFLSDVASLSYGTSRWHAWQYSLSSSSVIMTRSTPSVQCVYVTLAGYVADSTLSSWASEDLNLKFNSKSTVLNEKEQKWYVVKKRNAEKLKYQRRPVFWMGPVQTGKTGPHFIVITTATHSLCLYRIGTQTDIVSLSPWVWRIYVCMTTSRFPGPPSHWVCERLHFLKFNTFPPPLLSFAVSVIINWNFVRKS